jgi:hypothetical protein
MEKTALEAQGGLLAGINMLLFGDELMYLQR